MLAYAALTLVALAALLLAEHRGSRALLWVAKPAASTGFVAAALAVGALETRYGNLILLALLLSWLGDVLLIPRERIAVFRAGVISFLLGHVAFALAFVSLGVSWAWAGVAAVCVVAVAVPVFAWLRPHIPPDMKAAAQAYVVVISTMVVCAAGGAGSTGVLAILIGAVAFYLSDISVARDRFVELAFVNRLWGLPLYYAAQLILASTAASA